MSEGNGEFPCFLLSIDEGMDLLDSLNRFLIGAEATRQDIKVFQKNGGELSIVITMASGTGLSELDWEMLRRLSSLNIVLKIATYVDDRRTPRLS